MNRSTFVLLLGLTVCALAGALYFGGRQQSTLAAAGDTEPVVKTAPATTAMTTETSNAMSTKTYTKPADSELSKKLTPIQYHVTQKSGTEPPFSNEFWDNHEAGLYVDIVTGEPLFSSRDKFNSGTGWPSFTKPIEPGRVADKTDETHGMVRNEVRSKAGDSHLGHVFDDGPAPTGQRYCINSASLRFIPVNKLEAEGYGAYKGIVTGASNTVASATNNVCTLPKKGEAASCAATIEVATLAGGCFWGVQDILRKIPGVISTEVGYTGGTTENPTYNDVHLGTTGHAEAVKITFDKSKISYADLLEKWFFMLHDPTTRNRQGNDAGTQYRSAIFYTTDEQKKIADEVIARVNASGQWPKPVVTEVAKAGKFTSAEDHHQDYLVKHPGGYTCHYMREPKGAKLVK